MSAIGKLTSQSYAFIRLQLLVPQLPLLWHPPGVEPFVPQLSHPIYLQVVMIKNMVMEAGLPCYEAPVASAPWDLCRFWHIPLQSDISFELRKQ
jgi:hypothetical protein